MERGTRRRVWYLCKLPTTHWLIKSKRNLTTRRVTPHAHVKRVALFAFACLQICDAESDTYAYLSISSPFVNRVRVSVRSYIHTRRIRVALTVRNDAF